jgi:hypothetical protein
MRFSLRSTIKTVIVEAANIELAKALVLHTENASMYTYFHYIKVERVETGEVIQLSECHYQGN